MSKSLALAVAFVATASGAAFAQIMFDSPGPGYRQQRDGSNRSKLGPAADRVRPSEVNVLARIKQTWPAERLKSVSQFSPADEGAAERVRRALTDAGIPYLVTAGAAPVVFVDPSRVAEAKALLQKLSKEGHWSVKTVTAAGDFE